MKRLILIAGVLALVLALATTALAQSSKARVRVVHASPDAPAVDVWVNNGKAFSNIPFKGITSYASLDSGSYNVQVVPAGATEPVVIQATLDLKGGTDYTVVAVGQLAAIEPLVLTDNNSAPAAGKAHVRFVHASPDAPAVDIAVKGGPVLFRNIPFKGVGDYLPVDAGTYDLDVRVAGTDNVALSVPGVKLSQGTVYTIFAMGLAGGQPALEAVASVDAAPQVLPQTGEAATGTNSLGLVLAISLAVIVVGGMLRLSSVRA